KELYTKTPLTLDVDEKIADTLKYPLTIKAQMMNNGQVKIEGKYGKGKFEETIAKLPGMLNTPIGTFMLSANALVKPEYDKEIIITVNRTMNVVQKYLALLNVEPTSKTTSVINLLLSETNVDRGVDFLNKLIEMYNLDTNEDKNKVAKNTAKFIDERLEKINIELGMTERDLESYKKKEGITNLTADAKIFMQENSEYQKKRVEVETQLRLVKSLQEYMLNKANGLDKLVPANIGLADKSLLTLSEKYNELILERGRILRTTSDENPVIINLTSSIKALHANILTSLSGVYQSLNISKKDLDYQANLYNTRIENVPTQEREYTERARQQQIKAELFLMLLQKREENSLALAVTANSAKIIDEALATDNPVSPKKPLFYLIALLLGCAIPVIALYLIEYFSLKIKNRVELEKLTNITILGEVNQSSTGETLVVKENHNNHSTEAFRGIRTNLKFLVGSEGHKVLMVTSSVPGEGKTFISMNLAISISLVGKKVALVGMDVRKPMLANYFAVDGKKGATNYISGMETDLNSLIQPSGINDNFKIVTSGIIPPNPAELLMSERLDSMIEQLKKQFDYIILDCAPVSLVTDSLILSRVADATIYVSRANYTYKKTISWINELVREKKLPSLSILLNGVEKEKSGYGYGYGYGGHYGGYSGYGEDDDEKTNKKTRNK
ncbi:MAG: polysaccharide biosynthesis tyrosine autokinase, partial [Bacteroides sp.]